MNEKKDFFTIKKKNLERNSFKGIPVVPLKELIEYENRVTKNPEILKKDLKKLQDWEKRIFS